MKEMKKLFLTMFALFGMVILLNAQNVGQMWVGGSLGIYSTKVKAGSSDVNFLNFKVLPEFGYVLNDKIGLGVSVGYQQDNIGSDGSEVIKMQTLVVNPFVRYSVLKGNLGGIFIDGGIAYSHGKAKELDVTVNGYEIGFRPGVAFNVSDRISLNAKFGFLGFQYNDGSTEYGFDAEVTGYGFNFDLSNCLLGINFVF